MGKIKGSIFCLLLLSSVGGKSWANDIRVVFTDWCPYMCVDDSQVGYAVEVFQLALSEMGVSAEMSQQPYYKAIQMLKKGEADAIPAMYDYDLDGITAANIAVGQKVNQYYIVAGTDWYYTNPVSLEKVTKLGLLGGQSYEPVVELFKRKNRDSVLTIPKQKGTQGLMQALLSGKVSAILQDANAVNYYKSSSKDADNIRLVGSMREPQAIVVGFSEKMNKQQEFLDKFNAQLNSLRESGKFQAILAKYQVKDWQ